MSENNNGWQVWLDDTMVLVLKPYLAYGIGTHETDYPASPADHEKENLTSALLAGELEFAKKISDTMALSAVLGYSSASSGSKDADVVDESDYTMSKLSYEVGLSFLPATSENYWTFALSAGNKTFALPSLSFWYFF
jgi:hypothetical protein